MIFGSITAIRQRVINKMVSYSSAAQIGYIYLGIGLGPAGLVAATFHLFTHALCKPLLFSTSNRLIDASGKKRKFENLKGTGYADRLAGIGFTIGALSMVGCPFFAGFISKYLFVVDSIGNVDGNTALFKAVVTIFALVVSTLLNTIYYLRTVITIYSPADNPAEYHRNRYDLPFVISSAIFAILIVALGVFPAEIIEIIEKGIALLG